MNKELSTQMYIIAFAAAAVALGVLATYMWPVASNTPSLWLLGLLVLLVALAGRMSILLSRQAEASLFTVPLFVAVLLAHPAEAALVGAIGTLAFQLMLRRPARAVAFNTGMAGLAGGLGGIVFFSLRPEIGGLALTQEHMIAAAMAGLVMHIHNILPVVGMITIRKGRGFWLFWAESYMIEAVVEGMLLSLGLIAALLVIQQTWALALMAVPAFAAYHVLKHTVEYAAKKGMAAEELEQRLRHELESWQIPSKQNSEGTPLVVESTAPQPRASIRSMLR